MRGKGLGMRTGGRAGSRSWQKRLLATGTGHKCGASVARSLQRLGRRLWIEFSSLSDFSLTLVHPARPDESRVSSPQEKDV